MGALLILVLGIITFVTFCSTDDQQAGGDQVTLPIVTCSYLGLEETVPYKMKVDEIPKGCDNILFATYYGGEKFPEEDIQAIQSLLETGHSVYTMFSGMNKYWVEIMTTDTKNDVIETMANFVKDNNISGLLVDTYLLYNYNITDYATHMNTLVSKIKQFYPVLIVGMVLNGNHYPNWPNKMLFDFSVSNFDFFLIDTSGLHVNCHPGVTRRLPEDKLKQAWQSISEAGMDPNRVLASFGDRVSWILNGRVQNSIDYSQYCAPTENDPKGDYYCPDSMQIFYEQAQFAKQNSKGIFLTDLNKDDYKGSCGCGLFPVARAYIDGWNSKEPTCSFK